MVNTNKILTVSYGTFSCTLEGFEDSFGTMTRIAEYFQQLSADDRYFGAEPPTPDAEMLARIAEREIARRVEASVDKENIVLRADPASILPVAARAAEEPRKDEEKDEVTAAQPAIKAEAPQQKQPEIADDLNAPVAAAAAAALAPTAEQAAPVAEPESTASDMDETPIDGLEDILAASAEQAEEAPADAVAEIIADDADEPDTWSPEDAAAFFESGTPTTPAPAAEPDISSVAAKLQRIRAVVDQEEPNSAPDQVSDFSEDEHAQDFLADAHDDIEAALAIDDQAEQAMMDNTVAVQDSALDALESLEAETEEDEDIQEVAPQDEAAWDEDDYDEDEYEEDISDDVNDEISALLERFGGDAEADVEIEPEEATFDDETHQDVAEIPHDDLAEDADFVEDSAEPATPVRARVIKMKRADFEAAVAAGTLEEEDDADDDMDDVERSGASQSDSSLSAEDEADLMRELAAVEAELDAQAATTEVNVALDDPEHDDVESAIEDALENAFDTTEDPEGPMDLSDYASDDDFDAAGKDSIFAEDDDAVAELDHQPETQRVSTRFAEDADDDMARMFDKAASQMDEETGKGRRNAIAHLRAAVAAAKAEESAGGNLKGQGSDTEVYRDDLASVVRPRRPEGSQTRPHTRRPETQRPAPLKLVAEQRVDIDDDHPKQPVRPRRVAMQRAEAPAVAGAGSEFAEYAEEVGANTLPELLEAAAAYLSFVEGQEQFSRPQLMTQIRQVEPEDFSREDGLRSFGQLLREGKIEKLEGGRFRAAESISFRPDARAANG